MIVRISEIQMCNQYIELADGNHGNSSIKQHSGLTKGTHGNLSIK